MTLLKLLAPSAKRTRSAIMEGGFVFSSLTGSCYAQVERVTKRMRLKHKNTTRWARHALQQQKHNPMLKQALTHSEKHSYGTFFTLVNERISGEVGAARTGSQPFRLSTCGFEF